MKRVTGCKNLAVLYFDTEIRFGIKKTGKNKEIERHKQKYGPRYLMSFDIARSLYKVLGVPAEVVLA